MLTIVEIPFYNEFARTEGVVKSLLTDNGVDLIILDNNGSTDEAMLAWLREIGEDPRVLVRHNATLESGLSLYKVWNDAVISAQLVAGDDPVNVCILNNDIQFRRGTVSVMAEELRKAPPEVAAVYPDYNRDTKLGIATRRSLDKTRGTWRQNGMSGFAFMFKGELMGDVIPFFDERYHLLYGDGDFVESLAMAGLVAARINGLPLKHRKSTTLNSMKWTRAVKAEDTIKRKQKVEERKRSTDVLE